MFFLQFKENSGVLKHTTRTFNICSISFILYFVYNWFLIHGEWWRIHPWKIFLAIWRTIRPYGIA